jgi:hypothetical protein
VDYVAQRMPAARQAEGGALVAKLSGGEIDRDPVDRELEAHLAAVRNRSRLSRAVESGRSSVVSAGTPEHSEGTGSGTLKKWRLVKPSRRH